MTSTPPPAHTRSEPTDYGTLLEAEGRKWGDHLEVEASGRWSAWLDHPGIARHYARRGLLDGLPWEHWVAQALGRPAERSLDLGCGAGSRSIAVFHAGSSRWVEGIDLSSERIAEAEASRTAQGIPGEFRVGDVNRTELPEGRYDLIFSAHSFHHFLELEHIMEQVHRALTPDGLFILEEFVGPTQFQWTDAQLELARVLLERLPESLRTYSAEVSERMDGSLPASLTRGPLRWIPFRRPLYFAARRVKRWILRRPSSSFRIKRAEGRPPAADVVAMSPFESIRSAEIVPLFERSFRIVHRKHLGGTIQHLLYNGIMHNFQTSDIDTEPYIQAICGIEDSLIDAAMLDSDFELLVGSRKPSAG